MFARIVACVVLPALCAVGASVAQERLEDGLMPPHVGALSAQEAASPPADSDRIRSLVDEILAWLSADMELPLANQPPRIAFVSNEKIASLRYKRFPGEVPQPVVASNERTPGAVEPEIVAVYVDDEQTVYLPVGWAGDTPTEVSVLVHELVHHLQNLASEKFACPQAREKAAYAAQERWLARSGRTLQGEFEIDPMTLLVRTSCVM